MMKIILILVTLSLLLCSTASAFQGGGGESTKQRSSNRKDAAKRTSGTKFDQSVTIAEPGFYITLSRCHACVLGPRQQDAMLAFRDRGISAFYGSPTYDKSFENIDFVEKLSRVYPNAVMVTLFVGPFQTGAAAQRVVSEIPSILSKQIAEDRRMGTPEGPMGLYEVEVRRVRSDKVTGSFASLPPEDFEIRPGIGVGRVLIGNSKSEVLAVLGQPRDTEVDSDSWRSGSESLTVSYRDGVVSQISVSSSRFHTATGLTIAGSSQAFLKAFPTRAKYCCNSQGASASWDWTCWDAVTKGIAMQKGDHETLIVHRMNEAWEKDGDCKRCR